MRSVGLFQQWREAPERAGEGKFMAAFFQDAPFGVVEVMHNSVGRDALGATLRVEGEKSGCDPGLVMQALVEKAAGDAVGERLVRRIMGLASHWVASHLDLELVRAMAAVYREIQDHKYALDDAGAAEDVDAAFKKAFGL
jgi:hypothetical protein